MVNVKISRYGRMGRVPVTTETKKVEEGSTAESARIARIPWFYINQILLVISRRNEPIGTSEGSQFPSGDFESRCHMAESAQTLPDIFDARGKQKVDREYPDFLVGARTGSSSLLWSARACSRSASWSLLHGRGPELLGHVSQARSKLRSPEREQALALQREACSGSSREGATRDHQKIQVDPVELSTFGIGSDCQRRWGVR